VFVTAVPNWAVGETILLAPGERLRIVGIETELADELLERDFSGVLTVEPA